MSTSRSSWLLKLRPRNQEKSEKEDSPKLEEESSSMKSGSTGAALMSVDMTSKAYQVLVRPPRPKYWTADDLVMVTPLQDDEEENNPSPAPPIFRSRRRTSRSMTWDPATAIKDGTSPFFHTSVAHLVATTKGKAFRIRFSFKLLQWPNR